MFITRTKYAQVSEEAIDIMNTYGWTYLDSDTLCTSGFVFFDYHKALYNDTVIASIFNIDRVMTHFGGNFVRSQLKFQKSMMSRYGGGSTLEDSTLFCQIETYFSAQMFIEEEGIQVSQGAEYTPAARYMVHSNVKELEGFAYSEVEHDIWGASDYSRFIPRAFGYIDSDGALTATGGEPDPDYEMSMFEFYDYQSWASVMEDEWYKFDITMNDYTVNAVNAISASYATLMTGSLTEYYEYAQKDCYYNGITETFNEFFVDGIKSIYPEDINSPWFRAPLVYNIHLDILTNKFEGNSDDIIEETKAMSATISPETGTFPQLEAFYAKFKALWDAFYEEGGEIYNLMYDSDGDSLYGSFEQLEYCNIATDMNDIMISTLTGWVSSTDILDTAYVMSEWHRYYPDDTEIVNLAAAELDKYFEESATQWTAYRTLPDVESRLQEIYSLFEQSELEHSTGTYGTKPVLEACIQNLAQSIHLGSGAPYSDSGFIIDYEEDTTEWSGFYNYADKIITAVEEEITQRRAPSTDYWVWTSMTPVEVSSGWESLIIQFAMLAWPNDEINGGNIDLSTLGLW